MDETTFTLTLEQQFAMVQYQNDVEKLDAPQLREMLLNVIRQGMVKDNLLKQYIKTHGV